MPLDSAPLSGTVYIPDTSSLVENPDSLDRLLTDGNVVVLLHQVIEELGRLQASRNKSEGVRAAARAVMRKILTLRGQGLISHELRTLFQSGANPGTEGDGKRGMLAWEPEGDTMAPYDATTGDNLIVAGARRVSALADECAPGRYTVTVVSEDSNVLLKCDAVGLKGEALRYGKLELDSPKSVYRGYIRAEVDADVMQRFLDSGDPHERALPFDVLDADVAEASSDG